MKFKKSLITTFGVKSKENELKKLVKSGYKKKGKRKGRKKTQKKKSHKKSKKWIRL